MHNNIILEGIDGSGKSTLARQLSNLLYIPVMPGAGKQRHTGEMQTRINHYKGWAERLPIIFDRWPEISDPIYNGTSFTTTPEFYTQNLVIYCAPPAELNQTIDPVHDTAEWRNYLEANYETLVQKYEDWAFSHTEVYIFTMKRSSPHYFIDVFHSLLKRNMANELV